MAEIKAVKRLAYSVLRQHKLTNISLDDLMHLADENGYTVLDYSRKANESETETLIQELGLTSFAKAGNSFVYKNNDIRLIFLNETMTAEEKLYALAHELGHVYCGHLKNGACCNEAEMEEEHEANEFAHYLLHPGLGGKTCTIVSSHKIATVLFVVLLILGLLSIPVSKQIKRTRSYYGEYYVTESGEKYHLADCQIIKDKGNIHRLTIEEYESGKYEPCQICQPDTNNNGGGTTMSLSNGYQSKKKSVKEKVQEDELEVAEVAPETIDTEDVISEAGQEITDNAAEYTSDEPEEEQEAEGYFFENLFEFTIYCKLFGGNKTIYWKEGDAYWKAFKYLYEDIEHGRYIEARETANLCLMMNPIGLSARFELCELELRLHDLNAARKVLMDMKDYLIEDKMIARFYRRMGFIECEKANYKVAAACYQYSKKFEDHPSVDQEIAYIKGKTFFGIGKGDPEKLIQGAGIPILSSMGINTSMFNTRG